MNIFYLDHDPQTCAEFHTDKHVVKMIVEYAQLLSTAHRVLDGYLYIDSSSGRKIKRWKLSNSLMENNLYKATHVNHPSAVWVRESKQNYKFLVDLLQHLLLEYTHRYKKVHKVVHSGLLHYLLKMPTNINDAPFTQPSQAMPEEYRSKDSISSYRLYYNRDKRKMFSWKERQTPYWIEVL